MKTVLKIWSVLALVVLLGAFTLKPVPHQEREACNVASGLVEKVYVSNDYDVFIKLEDNDQRFYINRGVDGKITEEGAFALEGQQVELRYPEYFTLLDPTSRSRHLSEVIVNGEMFYSEFE